MAETSDVIAPEPSLIDLIRELREALGMFAGAMPITPKEAWEQALAEVHRLRGQAGHYNAVRP